MEMKKPDFEFGNLSDVGKVRTENQDYYGRYDESFGHLIIVCDGMGGYTGGAIASRLAVESVYEHFKSLVSQYDPRVEIEQAFLHIQDSIIEYAKANPDTEGMGTTVVLLLIIGTQYWFANLGDSRLYLKRGGLLRQLTKDHSLVQNMVDRGILTEEQAIDHPQGISSQKQQVLIISFLISVDLIHYANLMFSCYALMVCIIILLFRK